MNRPDAPGCPAVYERATHPSWPQLPWTGALAGRERHQAVATRPCNRPPLLIQRTRWGLSLTGRGRGGTVSWLTAASAVGAPASKAGRQVETAGRRSVMPGGALLASVNLSRPTPK